MDLPDPQFWDHVEKLTDDRFECKFCGHKFAASTSISRIKWHLSGEKGHGVGICESVPQDVRQAAFLTSGNANKRRRTMVDPSNINETTDPPSTFPQQNNENANLIRSGVERTLMEDWSPEQEAGERNISRAESEIPVADILDRPADFTWEEILTSLKLPSMEQESSDLEEWKSRLPLIRAVLDDAEEKQLTNQTVKIWLSKLRDCAYDVEDMVDEFETEASLIKLKGVEYQASSSTAQEFAMTNTDKRSKLIKNITARLKEIKIDKDILDLGTSAGGRSNRVYHREDTTSLVKEPKVCGRGKDKEAILGLLKIGEQGDLPYSVIPIIGMGGIGKTTLAQLIYNDKTIQFDHKAWVCVSSDYDVIKVTRAILQHWESCQADNLNVLQVRLQENLSRTKFLIVLDDVWEINNEQWTNLCGPFAAGAPGSKVIVTSRRHLSRRNSVAAHKLEGLPHDECLRLFAQYALDQENFDTHPDLKAVGEKIVKRCKGLPLAAKTLGGLLHSKESVQEWEDILNSKIWDLPEDESDILPALRLSYHHLPSHLKQCFAYCAIFPKDYEFVEKEIVLLWMAQGFLRPKLKKKDMADLGHDYFRDLLSRSFFQQSSSNKSRYVMHDLITDLARFVSGETCFYLDDMMKDATSTETCAKIRHSAFSSHMYDFPRRFDVFHEMKSLRTFLALPNVHSIWSCYLSSKVLDDLVPTLKCLRALSLAGYSVMKLPDSIGALKLLRYLDLSHTWIRCLPESLGELFNLETLKLRGCKELCELPTCIGNLINLQCLDISDTPLLKKMPLQICKLTKLRTLPKFIVEDGSGLGIKELTRLPNLGGQLLIKGLQNVVHSRDAELASLKDKRGLVDLALEWVDDFNGPRNGGNEQQILNALKPPHSLEKLSLREYGGTEFPPWIGDHSFTKMVHLELFDCRKITSLPSLGKLAALRHLCIQGMDGVKEMSMEDFQSLETLQIKDMLGLEQWCWPDCPSERIRAGNFPKLHELTLISCPKLIGNLPCCLSSLKKLYVGNCQEAVLRVASDLTSLKTLRIEGISGLVSLHEELLQGLVALEDLGIGGCKELKYLWKDGIDLGKLGHLKRLRIWDCKQLGSVVEGEDGLLPCNLQVLKIGYCDSLESLPHGMTTTTMNGNENQQCLLEEISVIYCRSLKYFPGGREGRLPITLKRLEILGRDKLEFPEAFFMVDDFCGDVSHCCRPPHLEDLSVSNVSLASFPTSFELPTSLKTLHIKNFKMLKSFPTSCLHTLSHLTELWIQSCDELESLFPEEGLLLPNLIQFIIWRCKKLRRLPNHMENLTSLRHLSINSCSSLESFPELGFPPNLSYLDIMDCEILTRQPMSREWGLHALTSLKVLSIGFNSYPRRGGGMDYYFPDEDGLLLPTSLTSLMISGHKNLKSISRGIQHLTSLEELHIMDCPNLKSLPIKEGFPPPTLGSLQISDCPLLKGRCLKESGEYWPFIAHIPRVEIW